MELSMESRLQAVGARANTMTMKTFNALETAGESPAEAGTPNLKSTPNQGKSNQFKPIQTNSNQKIKTEPGQPSFPLELWPLRLYRPASGNDFEP